MFAECNSNGCGYAMLFSLSSVQQYMLTSVCIQHTCAELYVLAFGLHSLWDAFEISDMFDKWWTMIYSLAVP